MEKAVAAAGMEEAQPGVIAEAGRKGIRDTGAEDDVRRKTLVTES